MKSKCSTILPGGAKSIDGIAPTAWIVAAAICLCFTNTGEAAQAKSIQRILVADSGTQSTPVQGATQSTTLQTGTQSTTLQTGTQSTTLHTGTQSTTLHTGTTGSMIQTGIEDEAGPVNILIILDASYSMKEKISNVPKMECAKRVLADAMLRIPPDINVGLRVFGQVNSLLFNPCRATALLVPLGQGNRGSVIREVRQLEPTGMTPLDYALHMAVEDDFRNVVGRKVIILITDGMDTCGGNPCAYIAMLPRFGIKIKVDVVGVDLKTDRSAKEQLNCIARTSGGKYYDANTAADLIDSVSASVDKAISGRVIMHPNAPTIKNSETPPEGPSEQPTPQPAPPRTKPDLP